MLDVYKYETCTTPIQSVPKLTHTHGECGEMNLKISKSYNSYEMDGLESKCGYKFRERTPSHYQ